MTIVGIACEDRGHFSAVTTLVDALVLRQCAWLDGIMDHCRQWTGMNNDSSWYNYELDDGASVK